MGQLRHLSTGSTLRFISTLTLVLTTGLVTGCEPAEPPAMDSPETTALSLDAILGAWETDLEHNRQHGRFAVEFVRHDSGAVIALMSMPPIDVWSIPAWQVTMEGDDKVRMGTTALVYDAAVGTLTGVMPDSIVPVHRIPFILRRVEAIERPANDQAALPAREPVWTFKTGGPIWAGVAYADGIVYIGSDSGDVHALDARTGKESWRFASHGAIRARPLLDDRYLLVHSDDGYLDRLDATSGAVDWRARLGPALQRISYGGDDGYRYDGYASGPTIVDGIIYMSHAEGRLLAIDASTGEEYWDFRADDQIASTPLVRDGRVYVGSFDGKIRAIHAQSGTLLWEHPTGAAVPSSASWHDGKVIIGSRSYDLLALNAGDGSVAWNYYHWFSWIESTAAVRDGIAYIGSSDSQLLNAIEAGTGRLRWAFDTTAPPGPSRPSATTPSTSAPPESPTTWSITTADSMPSTERVAADCGASRPNVQVMRSSGASPRRRLPETDWSSPAVSTVMRTPSQSRGEFRPAATHGGSI